jgi:hypothetical protein
LWSIVTWSHNRDNCEGFGRLLLVSSAGLISFSVTELFLVYDTVLWSGFCVLCVLVETDKQAVCYAEPT